MALQKLASASAIRIVHDVVTIEYAARLMSAEFHRDALRLSDLQQRVH